MNEILAGPPQNETGSTSPASAVLDVRDLRTTINGSRGQITAVDGITFAIGAGEAVGLVGESGSGKSVTALSILALTRHLPGFNVEGKVLFQGVDLLGKSERELGTIRGRQIAMIFQDPASHLDPSYPVGEAIVETIQLHKRVGRDKATAEAERLLTVLRIPAARAVMRAYPFQLSGGMCQRIMIAAAIACQPVLLMADECTSGLDATVQASLLRTLSEMRSRFNMSILMTTHNVGVVERICSRIIVMYAGKIMESGETAAVLKAPLHPYTRALLESLPTAAAAGHYLKTIPGEPPSPLNRPKGCPFFSRCNRARPMCENEPVTLREIEPNHWSACHFADEMRAESLAAKS